MFGFVTASLEELTKEQRQRYQSFYCGICKSIGRETSQLSRFSLSYDMIFLALILSSLYEPEEKNRRNRCVAHPLHSRDKTESSVTEYAADMNVALAYYSADDHWRDSHRMDAFAMRSILAGQYAKVAQRYPRQCAAIEESIRQLSALEQEKCSNPDLPANCFGRLMSEIFDWKEDEWSPYLREMAWSLGRFIYFVDAVVDYEKDRKKENYNPFLAMGGDADYPRWEEYLVMEMGRCTHAYEMLPLVQDKALMDNILYSGVWLTYRQKRKKTQEEAQEDPT